MKASRGRSARPIVQRLAVAFAIAFASAASACGYHSLYTPSSGGDSARLHVKLVRSLVADAVASDEVVSGVREQLARDGALAAGDGYPRVEVEVLREDVTSDAIAAPPGAGTPVARGLEIALVVRAWLVSAPDAPKERDTGDLRAADLVAPQSDVRFEVFARADAARAVARRIGQRLALKLLGHPAPASE